jgi:hypothetical protein
MDNDNISAALVTRESRSRSRSRNSVCRDNLLEVPGKLSHFEEAAVPGAGDAASDKAKTPEKRYRSGTPTSVSSLGSGLPPKSILRKSPSVPVASSEEGDQSLDVAEEVVENSQVNATSPHLAKKDHKTKSGISPVVVISPNSMAKESLLPVNSNSPRSSEEESDRASAADEPSQAASAGTPIPSLVTQVGASVISFTPLHTGTSINTPADNSSPDFDDRSSASAATMPSYLQESANQFADCFVRAMKRKMEEDPMFSAAKRARPVMVIPLGSNSTRESDTVQQMARQITQVAELDNSEEKMRFYLLAMTFGKLTLLSIPSLDNYLQMTHEPTRKTHAITNLTLLLKNKNCSPT